MFITKRSVSPLIATILLILVSVILITVVLTWGSDFAKDKLSRTQTSINDIDLTGLITSRSISSQNILISNNHSSRDLNIIGYKIISSLDHYLYSYFENKIYYLDEPVVIGFKQAKNLQIDCYPEESFFIDLITDQNTYIRTQILARSINDIDPLRCRLVLDFDSSSGFLKETTRKTLTPTDLQLASIGEFYSAEFNGTTSKIDTDSKIIGSQSITVCGWLYVKSYGSFNLGRIIDTKATSNSFVLRTHGVSSINKYLQITNNWSNYALSGLISLNKWYFFTVTCTLEGRTNFYIGDLNNTPALSGAANQSAGAITTGDKNLSIGGPSAYFDGLIPMLKIYNGILTTEEITKLWLNTKEKIK
jgi:hypothetical protein